MRILYVWDSDYPWDVRTEKVCRALTAAGHKVIIAARNLQGMPRREALPEGMVERLPAGPRWSRKLLSFPAFFNPLWLRHLKRLVRQHAIELIIVRDLPLAPTALISAGGRPVIFDMAENYPAMIRDIWTDKRQGPLDILVRNPALVAVVERLVLRGVDHTITVVEESSDRLVRLGVPKERTSVVSNTPPRDRADQVVERGQDGPLRIIYLGLIERHRGIGSILEAAADLRKRECPFHLDIVGDGRDLELFRGVARNLGLTPQEVTFHGRLEHRAAILLVAAAQIGLVPHEARESWNTTISNKLFDYMAAGLAVITSDAAPSARVVKETGAGLVFPSGNGAKLAEAILRYTDREARHRHGEAGQEAVRTRYNWEVDARVLLETVEQVGRLGRASAQHRPDDGRASTDSQVHDRISR